MTRRRAAASTSVLELVVGAFADGVFVAILQRNPIAGVRWVLHVVRWEARRRREGWPAERRRPW